MHSNDYKNGLNFVDVEEEEEMEIGYPTDVRHVSHIGWDSSSSSAPSWVRIFFFLETIRNNGFFLVTTLMCSVSMDFIISTLFR